MSDSRLSIRIDLAGLRLGPGKIALLEAIRKTGSISAAARLTGISYRKTWLMVEEINNSLQEPAVTTEIGGPTGGGATVTPIGEKVVSIYHTIESQALTAASDEFRAIEGLVNKQRS
jgi:molybdate transport system regulatory protein